MAYKPIPEIISDVVSAVVARWDLSETPEKPYYMHGNLVEMTDSLLEKSTSTKWRERKFPVIMLIQDFPENHNGDNIDATLNIVIACHTKHEIKASARYDLTFKPILYPIMDLFFEELMLSNYVNELSPEFTKTDRLYWGKSNIYGTDANQICDFVDAIEISNLKVNFLKNCE